jgi:molybdate transport system ATP-binding protein
VRLEVEIAQPCGGFDIAASFTTEARVTALFGPSGCGKTTILETIAGARTPERARILLDGHVLVDTQRGVTLSPAKRRIGAVYQDLLLFPHFSVRRNLLYGRRRHEDNRLGFEHVVEVLGLEPLLKRRPLDLSGGERQRVAIGRALLSQPRMLLLDEPLAALDDALKGRVLDYLERILERWELPVVFVTHARAEVLRLADWAVVLDAGRVVAEGPPAETLSTAGALELSRGTGPMNAFRIDDLRQENGVWTATIGQRRLRLPPPPATLEAPVYVEAPADAIVLTTDPVEHVSARNRLTGPVERIVPVAQSVYVAVDAGVPLWCEVTEEAVRDLGLAPGVTVHCLVKTQSFRYAG